MGSNLTTRTNANNMESNVREKVVMRTPFGVFVCCTISIILLLSLCSGLVFWGLKNKGAFTHVYRCLSGIQKQLTQLYSNYESLRDRTNQLQHLVELKPFPDRAPLTLGNIRYLIQLAQYNLSTLRNIDNAIATLELVEQQIPEQLDLNSLTKLRKLVAQYIAKLKALPPIDLPANLALLNNLELKIPQFSFPFIPNTVDNEPVAPSSSSLNASSAQWVHSVQSHLKNFKQFIVIRHLDKPIEPLLTETEQHYYQRKLDLQLQQAQWALLHSRSDIYQSSLQQFQELLQTHFTPYTVIAQKALADLATLKAVQFPTLPNLNGLLEVLSSIEKTPELTIKSPANKKELPQ